ncbi:permease-like cell division protein FtsX [Candidatus Saccharibacteria bacterium]|nr:permease-like cell division protein FtsX [Candidatus Saccharibacteria bacterium]
MSNKNQQNVVKVSKNTTETALKSSAELSKKRLSRITKTRHHRVRTTRRVFRYGFKSFMRNTWLSVAAIAIMTVTLVVLSATIIATNAMGSAIKKIEAKVDMSIYIKQTATKDQIRQIVSRIRQLPSVASVSYVSPEKGNQDTITKMIEDSKITDQNIIKSLREAPNKVPWTINVKLNNLNETQELVNFAENDSSMVGMLDARDPSYTGGNKEAIDAIASYMRRVELIGLGAAAIFAVIAILVVFNTIRMAIFNRKEEIYMMKLVGGSRWFIAGPFIVEAGLYGVVAAIISFAIVYLTMYALKNSFSSILAPTYSIIQTYWYFVIAALLVVGVLIGIISALLATRKYLKLK